MYKSTKTMEHVVSCAFRQHRAHSHCKFIHGYGLTIKFTFATDELDVNNWVVDFGALKSLKGLLEDHFDHKTVVASDDPHLDWFKQAHARGIIQMVELESTGCEKFAEYIYDMTEVWLLDNGFSPRCYIESVEVMEHTGNSGIYTAEEML